MPSCLSTGQVADLLNVTEPRINDLIRRGKIEPVPPVVAGRRTWHRRHVEAAAAAPGLAGRDVSDAFGPESNR